MFSAKINVVLCNDSRENFLLTRFGVLQQVLRRRNIEIGVLENRDLGKELVANQVLFFPYVTYKKLDPSLFDALQKQNVLLVSHGDERLERTTLWFTLCGIFDEYLVYNKSISRSLAGHYENYKILPEGYSNMHIPEIPRVDNGKLIYVGAPFKGRVEIIRVLTDLGYEVDIFGSKAWLETDLRFHYKGFLDNAEYYRVISEYKIMLALSSGDEAYDCHPNAKLGDSLSSKVIALTEFEEETMGEYPSSLPSIIRFRSAQELLESVKYIYTLDRESIVQKIRNTLVYSDNTLINYEFAYERLIDHILKNLVENTNRKSYSQSNQIHLWRFSLPLRILQSMGVMKVNPELLNQCLLDNDYVRGFKAVVQLPLTFVSFSKYYSYGSISIFRLNLVNNYISFGFVRDRHSTLFLPDIKAIWLRL